MMRMCKLFLLSVATIHITAAIAQLNYHSPPTNYGGKAAIRELIKNEMYYPPEARDEKVQGKVKIGFRVMPDGTTQNMEITERVHPLLDAEAIRLFEMILWEPATRNGKKVAAQNKIEFDFKVKRYNKIVKQRGYDKTYIDFSTGDNNKIYTLASLTSMPKPVFEKSGQKYATFMAENLKYPEAAVKQNLTGTVEVFFVVEPSGRPTNIKVLHGIGAGCNEEALRLAGLLRWQPGMLGDKPVRSEMTLNITFNLPGSENIRYVPANNQNQF